MNTAPPPDVPLPAGTRPVGGWVYEGGPRLLSTDAQQIDDSELLLSATVWQLPDGALHEEPPVIHLDETDPETGELNEALVFSVDAARALAQALLKLCNQIDGWWSR